MKGDDATSQHPESIFTESLVGPGDIGGEEAETLDEVEFTESLIGRGDVGVRIGWFDPRVRAWETRSVPMDRQEFMTAWDVDAWLQWLSRWEYVGIGPQIRVYIGGPDTDRAGRLTGAMLYIEWLVPWDVDGNTKKCWCGSSQHDGVFHSYVSIPLPTRAPTKASPRWLRAIIRYLVCHEADENLHCDGERRLAPHARGVLPHYVVSNEIATWADHGADAIATAFLENAHEIDWTPMWPAEPEEPWWAVADARMKVGTDPSGG